MRDSDLRFLLQRMRRALDAERERRGTDLELTLKRLGYVAPGKQQP